MPSGADRRISRDAMNFAPTLESGDSLEVGLVGRDGIAGTAVFPGITMMSCDGIVQIPGVAQRISVEALRHEVLADGREPQRRQARWRVPPPWFVWRLIRGHLTPPRYAPP